MTWAKEVSCPKCGWKVLTDEALMSWLCGKSPNPLSCPLCGELMPGLRQRTSSIERSVGINTETTKVSDSGRSASTTG